MNEITENILEELESDEYPMFVTSFLQHQEFVNKINELADKDGVCRLSQTQLAVKLGKSQTWVHKAISRLNIEDICIFHSPCYYRVEYDDLLQRGVFSKIIMLMHEALAEQYEFIYFAREEEVANRYNTKVKTLQMFKTYSKAGLANNSVAE
jgi:hypothetical protein